MDSLVARVGEGGGYPPAVPVDVVASTPGPEHTKGNNPPLAPENAPGSDSRRMLEFRRSTNDSLPDANPLRMGREELLARGYVVSPSYASFAAPPSTSLAGSGTAFQHSRIAQRNLPSLSLAPAPRPSAAWDLAQGAQEASDPVRHQAPRQTLRCAGLRVWHIRSISCAERPCASPR